MPPGASIRTAVPNRRRQTRRLLAAAAVATLVAAVSPAAGSVDEPEIVDTAGDANFVNGQGSVPGMEQGVVAAPASLAGADLVAIWFETTYSTTRIRDAGGAIQRVEHAPTALLLHIKTAGPIHPTTPPGRTLRYRVLTSLPDCGGSFELHANGSDPATARASLWATSSGCAMLPSGQGSISSVAPAFDGAHATLTFPLGDLAFSHVISPGAALGAPRASVDARAHISYPQPVIDEAVAGRSFTIGQDVPAAVECAEVPAHPDCQG